MTADQAIRQADRLAMRTGRPAYIVLLDGALSVSARWCRNVIETVNPPTNGLYGCTESVFNRVT